MAEENDVTANKSAEENQVTKKEPQRVQQVTTKNPKKVEQGKRLRGWPRTIVRREKRRKEKNKRNWKRLPVE